MSNSSYLKANTSEEIYSAIHQTVKEGFDFSIKESHDAWREYWNSSDRDFLCEGFDHVDLLVR